MVRMNQYNPSLLITEQPNVCAQLTIHSTISLNMVERVYLHFEDRDQHLYIKSIIEGIIGPN